MAAPLCVMEPMEDDDAVELDELQFGVERVPQDTLDTLDEEDDDDDDDEDAEGGKGGGYRRRRRKRRRKSVPRCSAASAALDQPPHSQLHRHASRHAPRHAPRRPHGLRESLLTVLGKLVVWRHGGATQYRQTLGTSAPEYLRGFIPIGEWCLWSARRPTDPPTSDYEPSRLQAGTWKQPTLVDTKHLIWRGQGI